MYVTLCFISEQTKEKELAEQVECRGKNLTIWDFPTTTVYKCRQPPTNFDFFATR